MTSDEEAHEEYLISRNLESVRKTNTKNFIKSINDSDDLMGSKQSARVVSEASSAKRQLNLSVRMKEGKAMFKANNDAKLQDMPRIDS